MADEIKPARNAADSAAGGEVSEDGKKMIEIIKGMKIVDLNNTVKAIEQEFGVSAQAPVAASASAGATADKEEKSSFNIELKEVGAKKIEVIKVVRDLTGKGLKEAKDLVDAAATAPQMVKENAKKEEADEIKKKFEAAGAKVELK
ncbi:MAG: 50S ribosomal protein L7/L12 [Parcubacteria group bacterium GW2011_GWF2_43_11]|nr:MAG: 50S ribosomal protein L7/L12 [Parcubacteria group bacterium GW2011_GWF2_43_11]